MFFEDFEADGFLPLQSERIQRIKQVYLTAVGEILHDVETAIEVAVDLENARAVQTSLSDFARRNLPRGQQDERLHPAASAVGGEGCAGVAGRGTREAVDAEFLGNGNADGHPAVLERARRIHSLVFDAEAVDADLLL
ncbi:MAG: hypothetical protein J07HN6_00181 [Halonotius sp. J07HN6]|nr:MAG: hypothetical protein J07HN6_00181 [Halonotius sp. J07HN6]